MGRSMSLDISGTWCHPNSVQPESLGAPGAGQVRKRGVLAHGAVTACRDLTGEAGSLRKNQACCASLCAPGGWDTGSKRLSRATARDSPLRNRGLDRGRGRDRDRYPGRCSFGLYHSVMWSTWHERLFLPARCWQQFGEDRAAKHPK